MTTYVVDCTCGHDIKVEARSREDAVAKAMDMMDEKGIKEHWGKYHKGESVPSVKEIHEEIANNLHELAMA